MIPHIFIFTFIIIIFYKGTSNLRYDIKTIIQTVPGTASYEKHRSSSDFVLLSIYNLKFCSRKKKWFAELKAGNTPKLISQGYL